MGAERGNACAPHFRELGVLDTDIGNDFQQLLDALASHATDLVPILPRRLRRRAGIDREGFSNHSESATMDACQKGGTMLSLKTMTVSKLKELRRQVEAAIHAKVTERRHEIESELSKLSRLDGDRRAKAVRASARVMVAVKASKRLDESLITDSPKAQHQSGQRPEKPERKRERQKVLGRPVF